MPANILDVFNSDAFNLISMTEAFTMAPYTPRRIGEMNLFESMGVPNNTVSIEWREGKLALLPTATRGAPGTAASAALRKAVAITIPHIPHIDSILSGDLQGVRVLGSTTEAETVASVLNTKLAEMRDRHEVTHEHMKAGALCGMIYDADGTTEVLDLFTTFGASEKSVDFVLGTSGTKIRAKWFDVMNHIKDALGTIVRGPVRVLAGATWFASYIEHAEVKAAFNRWQDGQYLRDDVRKGFEFPAGVFVEEYRGGLGSVDFIPQTEARAFPTGVPGLYKAYYGPGTPLGVANTIGQPFYASQERMPHDKGISIWTESNPLFICNRPGCLVKCHTSN